MASTQQLLRNLDWNLLYTYVVIVDEGSITAAARRLHLSQPSISNALKRLEAHLGIRLIERKKGSFALTYQGQQLYEECAAACRILERLLGRFADTQELQGELRIQVASHAHCPPLDATLGLFHQRYPQVSFDIKAVPSVEILAQVAAGQADIGIGTVQKPHGSLAFALLGHEQMGLYCGRAHPLYGRHDLTPADLRGLDYVAFESEQPKEGLQSVARLRAELDISGYLVAVSPNEEEVLRLIRAGVGYGALTLDTAKPLLASGELWQLPPYRDLPTIDVHLITSTQNPLSPAAQAFVSLLQEQAQQHLRQRYFCQGEAGLRSEQDGGAAC
ncbi:LysR family transcriptional regulator [Balneatrix alpica]|uniref:LysR family transcriptional regulator n=1 Tax=Balneatrix alpica TaxID=75684 RepID=A0ABV5ZAP4_9GAMM|nr:LysR family transcriptional regulator [Balneatrix alpica]